MSWIRQRLTTLTNAGTAVDVKIPAIKPGQRARVSHIALENDSGETVTVKFGLLEGATFHQLYAQQSVSTADAFGVLLNLLLLEGDVLVARVTGTADKGPVTFTVIGEISAPYLDAPADPPLAVIATPQSY